MERVQRTESQHFLVKLPVYSLLGKIIQRVVHQAHVPFQAESKPSSRGGARHAGPGAGLLGDHHATGAFVADGLVQLTQKIYGFQVGVAAITVWKPLPFFA